MFTDVIGQTVYKVGNISNSLIVTGRMTVNDKHSKHRLDVNNVKSNNF